MRDLSIFTTNLSAMRNFLPVLAMFLLFAKGFCQLPNGSDAPDFTVQDLNGNSYSLYAMMGSNKSACLDFSATWCGPCWAFHQSGVLESVYNNLSAQTTVIFLESDWNTNTSCLYGPSGCVGGTQGNWVAGTPYPIADLSSSNGPSVRNDYNIAYYPTLYVISPDKRVWEIETRTYQNYVNWITKSFTLNATATISHSTCGDNGKVTLNPTGGFSTLYYNWSNGTTSKDAVNLPGGTYYVTISDVNTYFKVFGPYVVNGPSKRVDITNSYLTHVKCHGDATGSISVAVDYGTPPYKYDWSNSVKTDFNDNIKAGSYSLTVTDNNNCTRVKSYTINEPSELTLTSSSGKENCDKSDGFIQSKASGGVSPFLYDIGFGNQQSPYFGGLKGGKDYVVTVTDVNGCQKTSYVYVAVTNKPKTDAGADKFYDCLKDTINLDGTQSDQGAPYLYQWTTTNGHIAKGAETLLPDIDKPGKYYLKVTDIANKCFDIDSATVFDKRVFPNISATGDTTLNCSLIETEAKGNSTHPPVKFYWKKINDSAFYKVSRSITVIDSGKYILHVKDTINLCVSKDTVLIKKDQIKPTASAKVYTNVNCSNPQIEIDGSSSSQGAQFNYTWSTNNGSIVSGGNSLKPKIDKGGNYQLDVSNSINYCKSNTTVEVIQESKPIGKFDQTIQGLTAQFKDLSTGTPTSWNWEFGDGSTSMEKSPVHQYQKEGDYDVCLVIVNDCGQDKICQRAAIGASSSLFLICATNVTESACQTQQEINQKFNQWLGTATFTGGCNPSISNDNRGAPSACGGEMKVIWTVTSSCDPTETCSAKFTVAQNPVRLNCPADQTERTGQTQDAINAKFNAWVNSASIQGGCNATLSMDNLNPPSSTGGNTTVRFLVTSSCESPITCSSSFTVGLVAVCPNSVTQESCQTQSQITQKFTEWLASSKFYGGCKASMSNDNTGAPSACGGATRVTFTVKSSCDSTVKCSADFKVKNSDVVIIICPENHAEPGGQTQTEINKKFDEWLSSLTHLGGCHTSVDLDNAFPPPNTGGSANVVFKVSSSCEPTQTCTSSFTVEMGTATKNSNAVKQFEVRPNPTSESGWIHVEMNNNEDYNLQLINLFGEVVWSKSSEMSEKTMKVDMSRLPKGLYFVQLTAKNTSQLLKWIIE